MTYVEVCPVDGKRRTCSECAYYAKCSRNGVRTSTYRAASEKQTKKPGMIAAFASAVTLIIILLGALCLPFKAEAGHLPPASNEEYTLPAIEEKEIEEKEVENEEKEERATAVKVTVVEERPEEKKAIISAEGPCDVFIYQLTMEDMVYIAKVVWAEARGECLEGKVAVAATILNRYVSDDPFFDNDTIEDVVTQPAQFASIKGVTVDDLEACPECMEAVVLACKGWDPTRDVFPNGGALYFYNPDGVSGYQARIREGIVYDRIGLHNFHVDFNMENVG